MVKVVKGKGAATNRKERRNEKFAEVAAKVEKPIAKKPKKAPSSSNAASPAKAPFKKASGSTGAADKSAWKKPSAGASKGLGVKRAAPAPSTAAATHELKKAKKESKNEQVDGMLSVWEQLRSKKAPAEQKQALATKVVLAAKGSVCAMAMSHKSSRVLQAAVRFGGSHSTRCQLYEPISNRKVIHCF